MRRNQLFWGIILLLIGFLTLLKSMDIKFFGVRPTEFFWPAILILLGAWILFRSVVRGSVESEQANVPLQGVQTASVKINHGAGELNIHSGAGAGDLVRGSFVGGLDYKANQNGDRLDVRMSPAKSVVDFPFFGPHYKLDWDVALNANVPMTLSLATGANQARIDLNDLNVTDLKLETGASETRVTLPSRGRYRADFDLGAASLEITVPEGVSARIRASIGAADLSVNQSRFPRVGGVYQSPDFDTAANAVDMTIDAGAASIKVR